MKYDDEILAAYTDAHRTSLQQKFQTPQARHYLLSVHSEKLFSLAYLRCFFFVRLSKEKLWAIPLGHSDIIRDALGEPLEELPMLMMNAELPVARLIAEWRLEIGK